MSSAATGLFTSIMLAYLDRIKLNDSDLMPSEACKQRRFRS